MTRAGLSIVAWQSGGHGDVRYVTDRRKSHVGPRDYPVVHRYKDGHYVCANCMSENCEHAAFVRRSDKKQFPKQADGRS